MARYWVGGTGTWNTTLTTNWSNASGGAGGFSVPTATDDVIFDNNSNATAYTVTMGGTGNCLSITTGSPGTSGSMTLAFGTNSIIPTGNVSFLGNVIVTSTTGGLALRATSSANIDFNNLNLGVLNVTTQRAGPFNFVNGFSCGILQLNAGTVNTNNYNITATQLACSGAGTGDIHLGSSTITITGTNAVQLAVSATVTLDAGTSMIRMTNTTNNIQSFSGGNYTFYDVWFDHGTCTQSNNISGSNTYHILKDTGTVAHSILFVAGTTHTVSDFQVSGSSGKLISINSNTTATHALVKTGEGAISCDYLNIQHSVATPATTWYAGVNSTNNQAVATAGSGWILLHHHQEVVVV
jgi:hypothetical protein